MKVKIKHLSIEEIIIIHDRIIEKTGGFTGIVNHGNLDFTVDQVKSTRGIYKKATVMMYQIIYRHPFLDGSKRTGCQCARTILDMNRKVLDVDDEEVKRFTKMISMGKVGYDGILKWITRYAKDR